MALVDYTGATQAKTALLTNIKDAIENLDTYAAQIDALAQPLGDTTDEVIAARSTYDDLDTRLDTFTADIALLGNAELPGQTGNAGKYLGTTGTEAQWEFFNESTFTELSTSGTWTKPVGVSFVMVECWGAGGGGGSGRKGAASSDRVGGGGGGGGAYSFRVYPAASLGATEDYVVGASGAGGAAQSTNSNNGTSGVAGGASSFGATAYKVFAGGGGGGGLSNSSTTTLGGGGGGVLSSGGATSGGHPKSEDGHLLSGFGGASQYKTDISSSPGHKPHPGGFAGGGGGGAINATQEKRGGCSYQGGAGGGCGGAITSANAVRDGGTGGAIIDGEGGGGTGGTSGTPTGGNGLSPRYGGGGGYGDGGAGGAGATPAGGGGGGGGGVDSVSDSGAGGAGGDGLIRIYTWYGVTI